MKRIVVGGMLLLLAHSPGVPAVTDNTAGEIRSAYLRYYDAVRHKNLPAAMELVDTRFSSRLPDGTLLDFAGQSQSIKEFMTDATVIGAASVDLETLQAGPVEVEVTARCVLFYSEREARPPDAGPAAELEAFLDNHTRDTWIRTARGWKLMSTVYLRNTVTGNLAPQPVVRSARLAALARAWATGNRPALNEFWAGVAGATPLVEPIDGDPETVHVTFLWRGDERTEHVELQGGLPREGAKPLARLADTDVWYLTERMPKDSHGIYAFKLERVFANQPGQRFSATVPDPNNHKSLAWGSVFELPAAPSQQSAAQQPNVPKGTLTHLNLRSLILDEQRDYGVYTPAGFKAGSAPYRVLLLFDGEEYGNGADNLVPTPTILDNLIAQRRIPPTVLVLVNSVSQLWRTRDLTCSRPFADFLAQELLPEVRRTHHLSDDPAQTIIGGSSFGGLAAACAALMHSETFGNVLSMSGSYWFVPDWQQGADSPGLSDTGWVLREYARSSRLPVRFYLEVGRFESRANQVATNRHLRDILALKGYAVQYVEYDGGHDKLSWRDSLVKGLVALSGTQ